MSVESVLEEGGKAVQRALRVRSLAIWLGPGELMTGPAWVGGSVCDTAVPKEVLEASRSRRANLGPRGTKGMALAVPIMTPNSGLLGVIRAEAREWDQPQQMLFQELAMEVGYALETSKMYGRAIAAKERSEAILAHVGDGVFVTNDRGEILNWNGSAETVVGCPTRRAVGASCDAVLGLHEGERTLDCSKGCPLIAGASRGSVTGRQMWRHRPDGSRQPLLVAAAPVPGAGGAPAEVVHSIRDISRLRESDEAKTMFLATASHELKTPLTVIQGFAQLLMQPGKLDPEKTHLALDAIQSRAHQLNKIVDRLLMSSRIEAGRLELHPSPIDAESIVRERVELLAQGAGRQIELIVTDRIPPVYADEDALITVLDQLLDNAVKYSPGGERVEVALATEPDEVWVTVRDHGVGMNGEQLTRCFDKFWQAESSDARRFGGTGIGLYIVKSLVEAMRGNVTVTSGRRGGTTVSVALRRADSTRRFPGLDQSRDTDRT
ncbi:MAG TPA: PAS domain-containing sensor histidine kinase [Actinomycetota bacterium]|nr:PAS domain-containing sensor histidine kinase [Actinomycetota bacterium]